MHEMMRMNETVQQQISALKQELQGTLKALETWILEQSTKKTHGMKLQPKPVDGGPTAAGTRPVGGSTTKPPPLAADQARQRRGDVTPCTCSPSIRASQPSQTAT